MATLDPHLSDPLLSLRRAIASASPPLLTTSAELSGEHATNDLTKATHLYVTQPIPQSIPLSTPTRFVSAAAKRPIDLRSIYFAWQKKDVAIPEYISSAQKLNEALKLYRGKESEDMRKVLNLVFVERLDLITWLEGASEESEYIKPLEGILAAGPTDPAAPAIAQAAEDSADVASGTTGGVPSVPGAAAGAPVAGPHPSGRLVKMVDPRLQEIYNGERKMGDRNTVLRGIRPTDFSHVRKTAEIFLGRSRSRTGQYPPGSTKPGIKPPIPSAGPGSIPKKPLDPVSSTSSRRSFPIILLSPSASSLLRMSNIKSFLSDGIYVPPDHPTLATHTSSNILQIVRNIQTAADPSKSASFSSTSSQSFNFSTARKPTRFILVDSTADFKPDYWNRLVAVFTTGQTWQFKSYKWSSPPELFKHATGIYVGWRGEDVPKEVKGWGRGVRSFAIDRWDEKSANLTGATNLAGGVAGPVGGSARWRDREVVEGIWTAIEEGMRARGWGTSK